MANPRELRVLFVEDDDSLATKIARGLTRRGCTVTRAGTLRAAELAISDEDPDVALLDLALPDGRGDTLIPSLRQKSNNPAIVILSGHVDAKTAVALAVDCDLVIPKPADLATLIEGLDSVTGDTRLRGVIHGYCKHEYLSPREQEAVWTAVQGLNNVQAADEMGVTENTLRTHWTHIFQKSGLSSQRDVVAAAMRFTFRVWP